jgi:Ferritin-like domain
MPESSLDPQDVSRLTNRRNFLQGGLAAVGAIGLFGAAKLNAQTGVAIDQALDAGIDQAATASDIDILNFALNLEYLEAEYYLRAAFGRGLAAGDVTGTGDLGSVSGGLPVTFDTPAIADYAREIANDEEAHVKFLRAALGSAAVARPTINLNSSFTAAARAAGVIGPNETFNPYANETNFLIGAYIFEDVGVTAYKGAARFLQDKDVLEAAAGLLGTEAYHAATVRTLLFQRNAVLAARLISDLRDAADGPGDRDQGIRLQGHANIVPTDSNGLVYSRTTNQVLNIVYLGGASANFGFFPDQLNGDIR